MWAVFGQLCPLFLKETKEKKKSIWNGKRSYLKHMLLSATVYSYAVREN